MAAAEQRPAAFRYFSFRLLPGINLCCSAIAWTPRPHWFTLRGTFCCSLCAFAARIAPSLLRVSCCLLHAGVTVDITLGHSLLKKHFSPCVLRSAGWILLPAVAVSLQPFWTVSCRAAGAAWRCYRLVQRATCAFACLSCITPAHERCRVALRLCCFLLP